MHPNKGQAFRPIDSTLVLSVQVQHVNGRFNGIDMRQSQSLPVRAADNKQYSTTTVVIDSTGKEFNAVGLFCCESSYPFKARIGEAVIDVDCVFAICGSLNITLFADTPTQVRVLQVTSIT